MAGAGEKQVLAERRAALSGMLWMLAGLCGFGVVSLLELLGRVAVVFTLEPNTEPGSFHMASLFTGDGVGGSWANAFFALALVASALQVALLLGVIRVGARPTPVWQPVALGVVGIALGGVAMWGHTALTAAVAQLGVESLGAVSIAGSVGGLVHSVTRIPTMIGAIALTTVLATRARPAPSREAGPYRHDAG